MEADADDDPAVREPGGSLSSWEAWPPDISALPARPGTVKAQLAAETLRLYAGDWVHFQDYCGQRGIKALPASAEVVTTFLAAPGGGRAAPARRLAAIDYQHRQRGLVAPGWPTFAAAISPASRTARCCCYWPLGWAAA